MSSSTKALDSNGSEDNGSGSRSERELEYSGWVYHLGLNSIGREYCHLRFLRLSGSRMAMYKRDPLENLGIRPIRKGIVSHSVVVEELGRRKVNSGELYVLRFYNRLDEAKKGEIACATAGEARKWMEAFDQAKQLAINDILKAANWQKLTAESELNFEGHRPRVRRYAHDLKRLVRIGKGPEMLLQKTSELGSHVRTNRYPEGEIGDAMEAHDWRCLHTGNGIRIFEDVASLKGGKAFLLKSVGVIDASVDTVFEFILSLDRHKRYEWDILTGDLELLDSVDGHYDVVYGTYYPKHLTWSSSKKDFVFSRQWFRGQDGEYTILQFPAVHKKQPPRPGYRRLKVNPSIWEIRRLRTAESSTSKCLLTQMLEVHLTVWERLKRHYTTNFEKTIPYALLCQVAGLREYFAANPSLALDSPSSSQQTNIFGAASTDSMDLEDSEIKDEFYDAIAADEDEDNDSDDELPKAGKVKLKNVSWAIASLALMKSTETSENNELDTSCPPVNINPTQFHGSIHQGKGESDTNCWTHPNGHGFKIRGRTYLNDCTKVLGGDPLLKLLAVDWLRAETCIDKVAHHPNLLVQSEAGKKLPFILVINLEIPGKPNYSLVLYYAAERPINKKSLLQRFIEGSDVFRDSRFKLIPSIVEGYWMVKRAVGTKACLLGKAVTCRYLQEDNFLEIDVDIGSSSVARSIMGLVLGYVTGIVVDLAILIEATEENELPEYILGTVRLHRLRLDSAVPYP